MQVTAAVTLVQGVRFVVVLVKQQAIQPAVREATQRSMSQLLANTGMNQLPWKGYQTSSV